MSLRRRTRFFVSAVVLGGTLSFAGLAHAQSEREMAVRRDLILQAQQAAGAGNHTLALDLAARAAQIQQTPSLRQFTVRELAAAGRVVEALGGAELCIREAERDPSVQQRAEIIRQCRDVLDQLRSRVGRVLLHTPTTVPAGFAVKVAEQNVESNLWGVPVMVTPGQVSIEASATGYLPFRQRIAVEQGQTLDVTITMQRDPNYRPPATVNGSRGVSFAGPIALIATGVVAVGVGGAFWGISNAAYNSLAPCTETVAVKLCLDSQANRDRVSTVRTMTPAGTGTVIAGGVVFLAGMTWLIVNVATAPRAAQARAPSVGLLPTAQTDGTVGAVLGGAF